MCNTKTLGPTQRQLPDIWALAQTDAKECCPVSHLWAEDSQCEQAAASQTRWVSGTSLISARTHTDTERQPSMFFSGDEMHRGRGNFAAVPEDLCSFALCGKDRDTFLRRALVIHAVPQMHVLPYLSRRVAALIGPLFQGWFLGWCLVILRLLCVSWRWSVNSAWSQLIYNPALGIIRGVRLH